MMKFIKYTAFPVLCGIVIGMMIATFTKEIPALSWLSFGTTFGMNDPATIDLSLIKLSLGLSVNLNVATIICITLSLVIAKYLNKR